MATTAGALSQIGVTGNTAQLSSAAATGGTGPYTYQWYRSTTTGFSPGAGTLIAGATALTLNDTGLIPNTPYFYKVVATDSGAVAGTSSQLAVTTTSVVQNQNQFAQSPILGQVDQQYNFNTISALVDATQSGNLYPGSAVKLVDGTGKVPTVIGCSANSDEVWGFINYDALHGVFVAGSPIQVSSGGNVQYLYSTSAVARGAQVQLDVAAPGAITALSASSGACIVGYAFDKFVASGSLGRVFVKTPSFLRA